MPIQETYSQHFSVTVKLGRDQILQN